MLASNIIFSQTNYINDHPKGMLKYFKYFNATDDFIDDEYDVGNKQLNQNLLKLVAW